MYWSHDAVTGRSMCEWTDFLRFSDVLRFREEREKGSVPGFGPVSVPCREDRRDHVSHVDNLGLTVLGRIYTWPRSVVFLPRGTDRIWPTDLYAGKKHVDSDILRSISGLFHTWKWIGYVRLRLPCERADRMFLCRCESCDGGEWHQLGWTPTAKIQLSTRAVFFVSPASEPCVFACIIFSSASIANGLSFRWRLPWGVSRSF